MYDERAGNLGTHFLSNADETVFNVTDNPVSLNLVFKSSTLSKRGKSGMQLSTASLRTSKITYGNVECSVGVRIAYWPMRIS